MTSDQILLSEWARPSNGAGLLGAGFDRPSCPICGHPTMDCTHDVPEGRTLMATSTNAKSTTTEKPADDAGSNTNPTTGEPLQVDGTTTQHPTGDAIVVTAEAAAASSLYKKVTDADQLVELNSDVVEEFYFPGTKRPSYRVAFTRGQIVRKSDIDALNARVKAARELADPRPSEAPGLEDYVDSTTLASGTNAALRS